MGKGVAVGTRVTRAPRTDPGERHYRTGLLPLSYGVQRSVLRAKQLATTKRRST